MAALLSGDRDAFVTAELEARKRCLLRTVGGIIVSGRDESAVDRVSQDLARTAPQGPNLVVLGPAPAPLAILRGRHRHVFWSRPNRQRKNTSVPGSRASESRGMSASPSTSIPTTSSKGQNYRAIWAVFELRPPDGAAERGHARLLPGKKNPKRGKAFGNPRFFILRVGLQARRRYGRYSPLGVQGELSATDIASRRGRFPFPGVSDIEE